MRILITGGAGYIGSHTAQLLQQAGHEIIIYDNLSSGRKSSLPKQALFIEGDVKDMNALNVAFALHKPEAVIHFAAFIEVEESITFPLKYYENNFYGTLCVLDACANHKISKLVFSSTAAVYGELSAYPVNEASPTNPINPYGQSKLMSEKLIQDFSNANSWFRHVILRYFNVAGAQIDAKSGQASLKNGQFRDRATHLITLAARAAAGKVPVLKVFGTDYETPDGTCIRDYIHIDDLANAHLKALDYLVAGNKSDIFNCGYGEGFSVEQVIKTMQEVSGVNFKVERVSRRPGDAPIVIADSSQARRAIKWTPKYNQLSLICKSAFDWECVRVSQEEK